MENTLLSVYICPLVTYQTVLGIHTVLILGRGVRSVQTLFFFFFFQLLLYILYIQVYYFFCAGAVCYPEEATLTEVHIYSSIYTIIYDTYIHMYSTYIPTYLQYLSTYLPTRVPTLLYGGAEHACMHVE